MLGKLDTDHPWSLLVPQLRARRHLHGAAFQSYTQGGKGHFYYDLPYRRHEYLLPILPGGAFASSIVATVFA
jgi:hypothetical protein